MFMWVRSTVGQSRSRFRKKEVCVSSAFRQFCSLDNGDRAFCVTAARAWNTLTPSVQSSESLTDSQFFDVA